MAPHPDRLFPIEPEARAIARALHAGVADLPIVSPHGHTDPRWYALDKPFPDPATLFVKPDHYIFRMLYSQGVRLEDLGIPRLDGSPVETDPRTVWRRFAEHFHLFRGTPTRYWFEQSLHDLFGIDERLAPTNADRLYDRIADSLARPEFRPRTLYARFGIEVIATTDGPLDELAHHASLRESGWQGRVLPTYRPDAVVNPERPGFAENCARFVALAGEAMTFAGYLAAHRARRSFFKTLGAAATDHGHPTARTADLSPADAEALFGRISRGAGNPGDADLFRGQMLTEMARMSLDDKLVLQIHPGAWRNHNAPLFDRFGPNVGADIPTRTDYVGALRPLLNRFGNDPSLSIIVFTLDESSYARELAPLAGHYPALKLGPAWWFHDSPEGMMRFREQTTETAGFYNTVGFNDDTRAFLSIPSRHDVARRIDCSFLARLVAEHRLPEDEAATLAPQLAYDFPKKAYKL
jgi:glucuronate isomerase